MIFLGLSRLEGDGVRAELEEDLVRVTRSLPQPERREAEVLCYDLQIWGSLA